MIEQANRRFWPFLDPQLIADEALARMVLGLHVGMQQHATMLEAQWNLRAAPTELIR